MILLLVFFGIITGFVSGFFGLGGGTVLVPLLLLSGFKMKSAVAISIMQMIFSSIYGSFLNSKKNSSVIKQGIILGLGGSLGGLLSGVIVPNVDEIILKIVFLLSIIFAIYQIARTPSNHTKEIKKQSNTLLFIIGFFIGTIAMSIGVGGALFLIPILVGFMYYNLKDAASLALFFVIFSSIAGFLSLSISGHMHFYEGFIVGVCSLIGVYFGIKSKHIIGVFNYKKLILVLYVLIMLSILESIVF